MSFLCGIVGAVSVSDGPSHGGSQESVHVVSCSVSTVPERFDDTEDVGRRHVRDDFGAYGGAMPLEPVPFGYRSFRCVTAGASGYHLIDHCVEGRRRRCLSSDVFALCDPPDVVCGCGPSHGVSGFVCHFDVLACSVRCDGGGLSIRPCWSVAGSDHGGERALTDWFPAAHAPFRVFGPVSRRGLTFVVAGVAQPSLELRRRWRRRSGDAIRAR